MPHRTRLQDVQALPPDALRAWLDDDRPLDDDDSNDAIEDDWEGDEWYNRDGYPYTDDAPAWVVELGKQKPGFSREDAERLRAELLDPKRTPTKSKPTKERGKNADLLTDDGPDRDDQRHLRRVPIGEYHAPEWSNELLSDGQRKLWVRQRWAVVMWSMPKVVLPSRAKLLAAMLGDYCSGDHSTALGLRIIAEKLSVDRKTVRDAVANFTPNTVTASHAVTDRRCFVAGATRGRRAVRLTVLTRFARAHSASWRRATKRTA
jgi:hypothetical protein